MEFRIECVRGGEGTRLASFVPVIRRIGRYWFCLCSLQMSNCTLILLLGLFLLNLVQYVGCIYDFIVLSRLEIHCDWATVV